MCYAKILRHPRTCIYERFNEPVKFKFVVCNKFSLTARGPRSSVVIALVRMFNFNYGERLVNFIIYYFHRKREHAYIYLRAISVVYGEQFVKQSAVLLR